MAYDFEWAIHFVIQTFGVQRDVAVNVVTDAFDIVTFGTPLGLLIGLFYRQLSKIGANGLRRARQNISLAVASIAMTLAHAFSRLRAIGAFAQGDEEVNNQEEKVKTLIDLVKKYYTDPEHIKKGKEVAANFVDKTVVIRIDINHLTGKAGR